MKNTFPFSELEDRFAAPAPNRFTEVLSKKQASGDKIVDLVNPNWYENGFAFPDELVDEAYRYALTQTRSYRPDSRGNIALREGIAEWYGRRDESVHPDSIIITPGSSFAYLALFRLLGTNAEAICPRPSYPLFEDIATIAGWRVTEYPLDSMNGWRIDAERLANRISKDTHVICIISPHNPTGAIVSHSELKAIGEVATRLRIPILFDEVFCEFRFRTDDSGALLPFPRPSETDFPLFFLLNGFSKLFALPGHKIGWIIARGSDKDACAASLRTLDHILDTFLPVNEVAQAAAAYILKNENGNFADETTRELWERLSRNRSIIARIASDTGNQVHLPDGGVYCIISLQDGISAEQVAIDIIEKTGISTTCLMKRLSSLFSWMRMFWKSVFPFYSTS